jgi:uncharacterized membrane protein
MRAAEVLASRILFWGGVLSIVLMALGVVGSIWNWGAPGAPQAPHPQAADPHHVFTSVAQVVHALSRWPVEPLAVVAAGILLLLVTPFVAVVAVFVVFAVARDRRYACITALLIVALLLSLLFINN